MLINFMARYNEKNISYSSQNRLMDEFCEILARMKTKAEVYNFLKDLLNRQERQMIIRRLLIAEMLLEKKKYWQICEKLKCGRTTISRVQRWLNFGRGGYKEAIKIKKKKK